MSHAVFFKCTFWSCQSTRCLTDGAWVLTLLIASGPPFSGRLWSFLPPFCFSLFHRKYSWHLNGCQSWCTGNPAAMLPGRHPFGRCGLFLLACIFWQKCCSDFDCDNFWRCVLISRFDFYFNCWLDFCRSHPLPLSFHVPLLHFIGVGEMFRDEGCCETRPRRVVAGSDCIRECFLCWKSRQCMEVHERLSRVG